MRKYEDKWKTWNPFTGYQLHSLQLQILLRGMRVLGHRLSGNEKHDSDQGHHHNNFYICYSTCSLNPIENEAVVQAALKIGNAGDVNDNDDSCTVPTFEIINLHSSEWKERLPLKIAKGLRNWKVVGRPEDINDKSASVSDSEKKDDSEFVVLPDNYEDAMKTTISSKSKKRFRKTMWSNFSTTKQTKSTVTTDSDNSDSVNKSLTHCARLIPHYANTGGFFCCLIKKNREWPRKDNHIDKKTQEDGTGTSDSSTVTMSQSRRKLSRVFRFDCVNDKSDFESNSSGYIKCHKALADNSSGKIPCNQKRFLSSGKKSFLVAESLHKILSKPNPLKVMFAGAKCEFTGANCGADGNKR